MKACMPTAYHDAKKASLLTTTETMKGAMGLSEASISHRFRGRTPWSIDEMYQLLDICRAQPEELHIYFPRGGKSA